MAIVKPGHVGDFTGKIGRVVVSKFRKLIVGRSAPSPSTKPPTKKQLDQQMKFGLVTGFLGKMNRVINMGYASSGNSGPMNSAVKDNLELAISGIYPNYELDYTKVMLTKSNNPIDGGFRTSVTALAEAQVTVTWLMHLREGDEQELGDPNDLVNLAFHSVTKGKTVFYFGKAKRSVLTSTFDLPFSLIGDQFQAYLFFTSADGTSISNSDYVGSFTLRE